jgi:DNA helicase-2/ATP-dependent DNA helicase PcrA
MDFNSNQIKAINHNTGNCCVIASAGSGKTTVLVNRIKTLVNIHKISQEKILGITFSKKAADNMKNKLGEEYKNVNIGTFHAVGYKMLKEQKIISQNVQVIKEWERKNLINYICVKELRIEEKEEDVKYKELIKFISTQKNNLLDYNDDLLKTTDIPYNIKTMRKIYKLYEIQKAKDYKIDFDDMLFETYKMLYSNKQIRKNYQNQFQFILNDEFQDVCRSQYEIVRLLGVTNNNVFCVGDSLQNIYEFRGADNNYILNFHKDWLDSTVINLNTNYRSSDNIVRYSNKLVKNMKETSHEFYIESVADKNSYKNPQFNVYRDEANEASSIADIILNLKDTYEYNDFAVLTRTNFQLQAVEMALHNKNIPYEGVNGQTFYNLKEIQDMISFLRLANDTSDDEAYLKIYNTPNRYLGKVFIEEISTYAKKYKLSLYDSMQKFPRCSEWRYVNGINIILKLIQKIRKKKNYNVGEIINIIREDLNYDKFISKELTENNDNNEKIENLDVLVNRGVSYNNIKGFLVDIDDILIAQKEDVNGSNNKVKLMTMHRSKGLEFPIVFLPGVNDNILPHSRSNNENEERRLLYVGMTRAEKELYISSTKTYNGKNSDISFFIYDIFKEDEIIEVD